jgi:hypothetical protein
MAGSGKIGRASGWVAVGIASAVFLLFASPTPAPGDVYTVAPGGSSGATVTEILHPQTLLREPISVNGHAGELTVSTTPLSLEEARFALKGGKGWNLRETGAGGGLLVDETGANKELRRHYVCRTGMGSKTMIFSLRLPAADGGAAVEWPRDIPNPGRAAALAFRLERTGTVFAMFSSTSSPEAATRAYGEVLQQAGWRRLAAKGVAGNAEYIHEKRGQMLMLQAAPSPDGGAAVSVFCSSIPHR